MQTQILVACKGGPSLRKAIGDDPKLEDYQLTVTEQRRPTRKHGWSKIYSYPYDKAGAINVHWDANSALLICRLVTKNRNKPGPLLGAFVGYLVTRYRSQIQSITIIP